MHCAVFRLKTLCLVLTDPVADKIVQTEKWNKFILYQWQNLKQTDLTDSASEIKMYSTLTEVVLSKVF